MTTHRQSNNGLRKVCECARRHWARCPHSWHVNFKPPGGASYRFSVDSEAGAHVASKEKAETLAETWHTAIRAGTFRRCTAQPATPEAPTTPPPKWSHWVSSSRSMSSGASHP